MKRFCILAAGIISLLAASFASAQTIVVIAQTSNHKVLTIDATSTAQRVPLVLADYVNTPNQRWTLQSAGGGKYFIYSTADGRAIEATTNDNALLYAADLNWEDTHQMWRFTPGWGVADRKIASAFNGQIITRTENNAKVENAQVVQTRTGNISDVWIVVPVHSVPNCGALDTVLGNINDDPHNLGFQLNRVRNALRVGYWIWTVSGGQDSAVWYEAEFLPKWDAWDAYLPVAAGTRDTYHADAYGLGADNEWHYLTSASRVIGQPFQPPRPSNP